MADIVIAEFMDEAAVASLARDFDTFYDAGLVDRPGELVGRVAPARALIVRNRTQVRGILLEAAASLKVIGRLGVGLDNIDLDACRARGIAVHPATGANDDAVAEYVVATALFLLRGAYASSLAMIEGRWPREELVGRELKGRTIGLIGFGRIAREVAVRAKALGAAVIAYDPHVEATIPAWAMAARRELPELLAEADIVSLHVPLTAETRHLIDAEALAAMRPEALLINAARGGIVDEQALADALEAGLLAGAALDVFETEPLTAEAAERFRGVPNLVLTPHIAGVTRESNVRVSAVTAEAVRRALT